MASSRLFTQIYRSLPPESQQDFVEECLAPLLDSLSSKKRDRIIRAAKRSLAYYHGIPELDLRGKKREMQTLLMMLARDDKVAFTRERSNREEIMQEAVHSISSWLTKIWIIVYEYKVNYDQAHECLLYALKSITMLEDSPAIGECLFNNMYVTVSLKNKERRTVKYFSFTGPRNLDQVCLWIWRDLFLNMLVEGPRSKCRVQKMLIDIEEILGWQGLEKMLYGGGRKPSDDNILDDDEETDCTDDEEDILRGYEDVGTDDEFHLGCPGEERCCCRFHAKYWPDRMNEEMITLREIVKARLLDVFRDAPDTALFRVICSISTSRIVKQLLQILSTVAGNSADSFKAALTIHTGLHHPRKILKLLENHYHYLRPSDCPTLLLAVAALADSACRPQALKFIERELLDSVQHIYVAVRSTFPHFVEEPNKTELAEILELPSDSLGRATRIERWVDRSLTSTASDSIGPMAFAAMMMGFPVGPPAASLDETDLLAYVDLNKQDPDLDDLREEFKPQLKPHFEMWNIYAQTMGKDSFQIFHRVYAKIIELMPFFKMPDVVTEMINRLSDRPSKSHVREAMLCVLSFCKAHRKKVVRRADQRRHIQGKAATKTAINSQTSQSSASPTTATAPTGNTPAPAAAATAPILPIWGSFGPNSGAPSLGPNSGAPFGPNVPTTNPNPPPPLPSTTGPIVVSPLPPPECNHQ